MTTKTTTPRYSNFDYLRLYLALAVVWLHGYHSTGIPYHEYPYMVPAFLGISGFVIIPSLESSRGTPHFFWKRFLRVMPAFVASLVVVALMYGAKFILPTLRGWYSFGLNHADSMNPPLWSLACEEVIYICVAVLFVIGAYKRPLVIWAMWVIATVVQARTMPSRNDDITNIAMLPSAFLIGNLLYIYRERLKINPWIPVAAVALLFAYYPFRPSSFTYQYYHQSLLIAALVWFGFAGPQIKFRLPIDISYGVYVYHYMFVVLLADGFEMKDTNEIIALSALFAILISVLSAVLIERPALRLKNWLWWKRKKPDSAVAKPEPALVTEDLITVE